MHQLVRRRWTTCLTSISIIVIIISISSSLLAVVAEPAATARGNRKRHVLFVMSACFTRSRDTAWCGSVASHENGTTARATNVSYDFLDHEFTCALSMTDTDTDSKYMDL